MVIFHSYVAVYQRVNLHFPMVFLWFSYGFPMVFLWFSYGFPIQNSFLLYIPIRPTRPSAQLRRACIDAP